MGSLLSYLIPQGSSADAVSMSLAMDWRIPAGNKISLGALCCWPLDKRYLARAFEGGKRNKLDKHTIPTLSANIRTWRNSAANNSASTSLAVCSSASSRLKFHTSEWNKRKIDWWLRKVRDNLRCVPSTKGHNVSLLYLWLMGKERDPKRVGRGEQRQVQTRHESRS